MQKRIDAVQEKHKETRGWTLDMLTRLEYELHEARTENAALPGAGLYARNGTMTTSRTCSASVLTGKK